MKGDLPNHPNESAYRLQALHWLARILALPLLFVAFATTVAGLVAAWE
jgi:hypothetical protein